MVIDHSIVLLVSDVK